jgi:hypothetical protein
VNPLTELKRLAEVLLGTEVGHEIIVLAGRIALGGMFIQPNGAAARLSWRSELALKDFFER